jgi:predicted site-specific integrase-resolvase
MRNLLTPPEVAEILVVPVRTLADWRYRGLGPPWVRVGRHARYIPEGVERYVAERTVIAAEATPRGTRLPPTR